MPRKTFQYTPLFSQPHNQSERKKEWPLRSACNSHVREERACIFHAIISDVAIVTSSLM
jgi:hypothetical protein